MARVHYVKKAKKDNPAVAKGMPYYYMIFRGGASPTRPFGRAMKRYFASYPTASQRTMNAYKSSIRAISENLEDNDFYRSSFEDTVSNIVSQLEEIRDQAQESYDNMPTHLAESSSSGQLLQERIEIAEQNINDIESLDLDEMTPSERLDEVTSLIEEV